MVWTLSLKKIKIDTNVLENERNIKIVFGKSMEKYSSISIM